jgi:hypothetical protein
MRIQGVGLGLGIVLAAGAVLAGEPAKSPDSPGLGDDNHSVGAPFVQENLAVFPVYASKQEKLGQFVMLEAALKGGTAVVREMGAEDGQARARHPGQSNVGSSGAQVNTLAIENKGKLPVLVLAGTVVKGGNQDRQIGQDFVIAPGTTTPVDAFCVEHGRWQGDREGKSTGGKFETVSMLAQSKVRSAGQYEGDQSKVWDQVAKTNEATRKQAESGTLMASLGDKDLSAQREALAGKAAGYLSGLKAKDDVVGLAYAVDGKVLGVRWFLNHDLFAQNEATLLNTAAMEALTARSQALAQKRAVASGNVEVKAVSSFITEAQKPAVSRKAPTRAANVNAYRESEKAYGSEALMEDNGRSVPVTTDFTAK